jgi:hypothetical protein
MSAWVAFDDGRSIGKIGTEGGVILRDEKRPLVGRITLKHGATHITVSCKIKGWMDDTVFFKGIPDAERVHNTMKRSLAKVIETSATSRRAI